MAEDNRQSVSDGVAALSLDRLATILDAYGSCSDDWPEAEQAAALALLAGSEEARRLRDEAAGLDAALSVLLPPPPSDVLRLRLEEVPNGDFSGDALAPPFWARLWIDPDLRPATFAAAMLLAFVVGLLMPSPFRDILGEPSGRPAVADGAAPDIATLPLVDQGAVQDDTAETVLASIPLQ